MPSFKKHPFKPFKKKTVPYQDYPQYLKSDRWELLRGTIMKRDHFRCAVCGLDWRKTGATLQVHHFYYYRNGESILGKERPEELTCLCSNHHPKGAFSKEQVRGWRNAYLTLKVSLWLAHLPVRALQSLVLLARKGILSLVSLLRRGNNTTGS